MTLSTCTLKVVDVTPFSEAVSEAEGRSALKGPRAISRAAKSKGFTLSHGTVSKVLNGTHGNVSDDTVRALAAVLPISETKLFQALGVAGPGPYRAPAAADRLTTVQRELINALIHQIVRPDEGVQGDSSSAGASSGGGSGLRLVEPEVSESDESLDPAALDAVQDVDEEPGGSDHDES